VSAPYFAHMHYLRRDTTEALKSREIQFCAATHRSFGMASRFMENSCIAALMDEFFNFML
jgi:hypothetical protein